jgi:hypothetical protein
MTMRSWWSTTRNEAHATSDESEQRMILKYGNYAHAVGEAAIAITVTAILNSRGVHYANRQRWEISGFLQGPDPSTLTGAINALKGAYAASGQDVGLYFDDGVTPTSHVMQSSETLGGVRVVAGPSFPDGRGGEYATIRGYHIVLEADFPVAGGIGPLLWEETLSFAGGGPRFVYLQTLTGLPQRQVVADATTYRVEQAGRAVAVNGYPLPAAPIWPVAEHVDRRQIARKAPVASTVDGLPRYETIWQYHFESTLPLEGDPTLG